MAEKGNCQQASEATWRDYVKYQTELSKLERSIQQKDLLLGKLLNDLAVSIDNFERRLILLEDRVYNGTGSGSVGSPCD